MASGYNVWDFYTGGGSGPSILNKLGLLKHTDSFTAFEHDKDKQVALRKHLAKIAPHLQEGKNLHIFGDVKGVNFKNLASSVGTPDLLWATPSCRDLTPLNTYKAKRLKEFALTDQQIAAMPPAELRAYLTEALGGEDSVSAFTNNRFIDAIETTRPAKVFGEFGNARGWVLKALNKIYGGYRPGSNIVKFNASMITPTNRDRAYLLDLEQKDIDRLQEKFQNSGLTDKYSATRFIQQYKPGMKSLKEIDWDAPLQEDGDFYDNDKFHTFKRGSQDEWREGSKNRLPYELANGILLGSYRQPGVMRYNNDGTFIMDKEGQVRVNNLDKFKKMGMPDNYLAALEKRIARLRERNSKNIGIVPKRLDYVKPGRPFDAEPMTGEADALAQGSDPDAISGLPRVQQRNVTGDELSRPAVAAAINESINPGMKPEDIVALAHYKGGYVK